MRTRVIGEIKESRTPYLIELNATHPGGLAGATAAFFDVCCAALKVEPGQAGIPAGVTPVTSMLYQVVLDGSQVTALLDRDQPKAAGHTEELAIFKIWPDYPMSPQIDRSVSTVKVDAARRAFGASGRGITWAVIDSGIQAEHPHFSALRLASDAAGTSPSTLHRDFTALVSPDVGPSPTAESPLTDDLGHGTHVSGIISGACPDGVTPRIAASDEPGSGGFVSRVGTGELRGMAPECELVSLKVIREVNGSWITSSAAVIAAIDYLMTQVNLDRSLLRVHGVNLSLGCPWDARHYAAGQSPLCQAINALVSTGVAVVVAAGNSGSEGDGTTDTAFSQLGSILEPGHAADCITVGSTHRDAPHTFGVSWTSARGPTLDGRAKPDLVAPGEWITSAATGTIATKAGLPTEGADSKAPNYAPDSGTSMATPHVSGLIAAFLSSRPEYVGRPAEVKRLLCTTATDLGRERYAQGAGVADLMRMLSDS